MALPVLDAVFASSADLPRRQLLSEWLVEQLGSGSIADFSTLPERYLYAKIAVSLGGPRTEQEYIELPKSYAWSDIYGAIIFNRTAPAAPSSLTLTPLTSSSIRLNWVTNGASVAYSVERSVDGAAFQVIGTTAIGATTATNTGLSIASNYQYRIRGSSGGFFTGYSNTASASTYDANASSFIATSGATDIVAINDFVLGVKTLGLWNSMVCWPLRSSQNAGAGTTAYSLGGLGTFNGTLANGPTWGANGVTFTNETNQHISTALTPALDHCIFAATQCNAEGANVNVVAGCRPAGDRVPTHSGWSLGQSWSGVFRLPIWSPDGTLDNVGPTAITNGSFSTLYGRLSFSGATKLTGLTLNAGTETVASGARGSATLEALTLGNQNVYNATSSLGGALPFFAYFAASSLNNVALRDLYKTTLGTGITFP